ncbi:MAG: flagellar basal body rod protein FlgC [Magnetovibrio sp.]|nr:flagellar basal body rod protein FlgC [Magnetovibrio sp.]|tara:strand:+ start:132 stop:542 length:411 start_codon:yes stop_codon:yes gene_type:complete
MDDIIRTMRISGSGMRVQGQRLRVIAQNIANANSLPQEPNENPYRRKVMTFKNEFDRATGLDTVRVKRVRPDMSDFGKRYEPNHPAADADGYVLTPNVNTIIELSDMREAQRSYEANMNVIKASKAMLNSAIELLR